MEIQSIFASKALPEAGLDNLSLMLIDMVVLGFICVILAPVGPFFKTTVQNLLRRFLYTR